MGNVTSQSNPRERLVELLAQWSLAEDRVRALVPDARWLLFLAVAICIVLTLTLWLSVSLWISVPLSILVAIIAVAATWKLFIRFEKWTEQQRLGKGVKSFLRLFPEQNADRDAAILILATGTVSLGPGAGDVVKYQDRLVAVGQQVKQLHSRLVEMNLMSASVAEDSRKQNEEHALETSQSLDEITANARCRKRCAEAVYPFFSNLTSRENFVSVHFGLLLDDSQTRQKIVALCGEPIIYGKQMFKTRVELRRRGGSFNCIGCDAPVRIDLPSIEDFVIRGKETKVSLAIGERIVIHEQEAKLYDASVCQAHKGVLCLRCTDQAVKPNGELPVCPKCGGKLGGLDQLVR